LRHYHCICLAKRDDGLPRSDEGLEEIEAAEGVFKERLDKMDATDLEAVAVHQEVHNAEASVETIGAP
jgi:hypothetical protein